MSVATRFARALIPVAAIAAAAESPDLARLKAH